MASSPKPAPAPDYVGAANATAAGNLEAVKYQTEANRVNQYSPWGSSTWTKDKDGKWTQTETLAPELQAALNSQLAIQQGKSDQAQSMLQSVKDSYSQPFNAPDRASYMAGVNPVNQQSFGQAGQFSSNANQNLSFNSGTPGLTTTYDRFNSSTPGLNTDSFGVGGAGAQAAGLQTVNQNAPTYDPSKSSEYAQKAFEAQIALMRPELDRQQQSLQNGLALQGLQVGTEANNNAQSSFSMARAAQENALAASSYLQGNDAARADYQQQLAGFSAGNAAKTQALNNQLTAQQAANAARTQSLQNEISKYTTNQNATTAENAARAQAQAQALQAYQAQNAASAQQYNQDAATYAANLTGMTTNAQLQASQNAAQQQAYQQAMGNYGMDYQAALQARNQPLNELNALLQGQQINSPSFDSYALQGQTQGADLLGAAQAQGQYNQSLYNAQAAQAAGTNSTMAGLAGSAAMAAAVFF